MATKKNERERENQTKEGTKKDNNNIASNSEHATKDFSYKFNKCMI
jgi:hypothetical protein